MSKPLVIVKWNDAHAGGHEQYDIASVPHAPMVIQTIGWLLREDEAGISVASELLDSGNYRSYTFVPKGMVVSVTTVNSPTQSKRRVRQVKPPVEAQTEHSP